MKQLTIEQKAEAYDKAIKAIKDNLDALNEIIETGAEVVNIQAIKNCFYRAFPELKENKLQDKSLLEAIEEKKESTCYKCKKENTFHSCQDITSLERCVIEHEKPANIVKPKFKVGDWITNGNYIRKIVKVNPLNYYVLQSQDNDIIYDYVSYVDKYFHLWTIKDIKDGDVLACENKDFMIPFVAISSNLDDTIYKGLNNITFSSYCFVGFNGNFHKGENGHIIEDIYPATKEQRDFLFTKMNEAGYEWNADKKELKKLEQKCFTWSKEDDIKLQRIIDFLWNNRKGDTDAIYQQEQDIKWLKSIKERIQLIINYVSYRYS